MKQTEVKNEGEKENVRAAQAASSPEEKSQEKQSCGCCGGRPEQK